AVAGRTRRQDVHIATGGRRGGVPHRRVDLLGVRIHQLVPGAVQGGAHLRRGVRGGRQSIFALHDRLDVAVRLDRGFVDERAAGRPRHVVERRPAGGYGG